MSFGVTMQGRNSHLFSVFNFAITKEKLKRIGLQPVLGNIT